MADEWKVIDDPEDPRLANTPLNPPDTGAVPDLVQPETEGAEPAKDVKGTFDDLKEQYSEAQKVFSGNRGLVLKSLQDYGASPVATAALLGDIEQESSFNPTLDDRNDRTGAHGLLQVGNQIWSEFDTAARQAGLTPKDPDYVYAQVPFMLDRFKAQHPERWNEMQNAGSAADAIEIFRGHPDWGYGIAGKRHAYGNRYQQLLGNIPPGSLMAGDTTEAGMDFAQPPTAGNSTFGDLIAEQARQHGEGSAPTRDGNTPIDYRKAVSDVSGEVTAIPEPQPLAEREIPDLLKAPEEEKAKPRHPAISLSGGGEVPIPAAFQPKFNYPAAPAIPIDAAPQEQLVGTPTGPMIPTPPDAAPSEPSGLTPLQQSFVNMGQGVANVAGSAPVQNLIGATGELASEMVPHDWGSYAKTVATGPMAMAFDQAQAFIHGDVGGIPFAGRIPEIIAAEKTPAFSKERYKAAEKVLMDVGMLAGGAKAKEGSAKGAAGRAMSAEEAAAAATRLDVPEMARLWDKMNESEREAQLAKYNPEEHAKNPANFKTAAKAKFKDLHEEDQRAVAESFLETEAAKQAAEPDYQYSNYEKFSGTAGAPTSTFGGQRARTELQRINPQMLLRQKLRAAQKAGEAGYERGSKEAKEAGKQALKRAKLQAKLDAKADAREIRETLETADKWLDADLATVQDKLLKFSRFLPLKERGKLLNAVASALRKPGAWTRDPGVIRRRAEAVLNRMAGMVYEVNRKALTAEIEKGLQRIIDSPSVIISNKQIARNMQTTFNAFKDKMSLDMLEAMRARMEEVEAMGRDLFHISKVIQAESTIASIRDIRAQGTLRVDLPAQYRLGLEEVEKFWTQWRKNVQDIPNFLKHYNLTMDSMDWNFMRFDQRMSGALYENLKLGVDIRYSEFLDTLDAYQQRRTAIKEKYKLTEQDYRKIAVHAELRQEGGLENLLASGFDKAEVLKYKNEGALTKGQRALLKVDDMINNELYPVLRDTYETHYNKEIGPKVKGYYPRIRDWEQYNSLSIEEGRFVTGNAVPRRTKTASGMTIQRQQGAVTKNMVNSDVIMNKHLEDVLYTTQMGPEIARIAKIVRHPEFADQVGTWGQKIFADYVDTLARNGGVESSRRMHTLDVIKRNVGAMQLGFRVTTAFLQPTALLLSMPYTKIGSVAKGITSILNKADREWILKTFPEVRESVRGGKIDDPAYAVYTGPGVVNKVARTAMSPIRWLDGLARMTAVEAFYRDALERNGIKFDRNAIPHPNAVAEAQRLVRMTQAGPLPKDQAQALSRGEFSKALLGRANVSVDQALLQFQSYIMNRWSLFKHGALQMGMAEKDALAGSKVMAYIILATYVEQLGREGIANVWRATFGMGSREAQGVKKEQDAGLPATISKKVAVDLATSIPIVSNLSGIVRYDSQGVPVADTLVDVVKGGYDAITAAKAESKAAAGVRAMQALIGAGTGLPTGQIGDIIQRMIREHARTGGQGSGGGSSFPGIPDMPAVDYPAVDYPATP